MKFNLIKDPAIHAKGRILTICPLEDHWLFSGKAAGTLKKLTKAITNYQAAAQDSEECDDLAEKLTFGLFMKEKSPQ